VDATVAAEYAKVTEDPAEATCAIVRLDTPYEARDGMFERFFHDGSLAFPAQTIAALVPQLDSVPTVVVVQLERPAVLTEIAEHATALVGNFGATDRALLDVLFGRAEQKGKLPFDLPSSMQEVEAQRPDVPFDMPNPLYRFGDGLSY
jgi:beta-glucosidase